MTAKARSRAVKRTPARRATTENMDGCAGKDCSHLRLRPFVSPQLVGFKPLPLDADYARAELDAKTALRQKLADDYDEVKLRAAGGDIIAQVLVRLMKGVGGDETCRRHGKTCQCEPDLSRPPQVLKATRDVRLEVESGGRTYKVKFEYDIEVQIVHGKCVEIV